MAESLYVCLFSSATVKVGRSIDPKARIASHVDRVLCVGITLVDSRVFPCVGDSAPSEMALIQRCTAAATSRQRYEWFTGLQFEQVCAWAEECANTKHENVTSPLLRYMNALSPAELSAFQLACGTAPAYLVQIARRVRQPSPRLTVAIERAAGGRVTRRDLRSDWERVWPDLDESLAYLYGEAA